MTPTPDAVKASALEQCLRELDYAKPSRLGTDLVTAARAELAALRRGVSVEEACRVLVKALDVGIDLSDRHVLEEADPGELITLRRPVEVWRELDAALANARAVLALVETGKGVKP